MASISITNNIVNKIITNATQSIYQNNLVRQQLPNYASEAFFDTTNDLLYNAVNVQVEPSKPINDKLPNNLSKDIFCYQSIRNKKMLINKRTLKSNFSPTQYRSLRMNKTNNFNNLNINTFKTTKNHHKSFNNEQQKFIKINPQPSAKIVPQRIAKLQKQTEQNMRKVIKYRNEYKKNEQAASKLQTQTVNQQFMIEKQNAMKLKNQFENNTSVNEFAYDHEGNIIYYDKKKSQLALKKQYPPIINYNFDNIITPEEIQNQIAQRNSHSAYQKIRSAKGNAFASSVLKTVNLSKISVSESFNPFNQDPLQFMLRNDLFNNNHSRQTSSIPYLQVKEGTVYTQTQTKQSACHKSVPQSTTNSHYLSMQKGQFKKYVNRNRPSHKSVCEQNMDIDKPQQRRETMTANVNKRKEQDITRPKTTQNLGRIMTSNHKLALSLIE